MQEHHVEDQLANRPYSYYAYRFMSSMANMDDNPDSGKRIKITQTACHWIDLPQDILVFIHNKLCLTDQLCFRAVCKTWRLPADRDDVKCSDRLPWVIHYQKRYSSAHEDARTNGMTVCASKDGWMLHCRTDSAYSGTSIIPQETVSKLILTDNTRFRCNMLLPRLAFSCRAATFTTSPTSPECDVLVLCNPSSPEDAHKLCIARLYVRKSQNWTIQFLEINKRNYHLYYIKGNLYCVGDDGSLMNYNLADQTWQSLTKRLPGLGGRSYWWKQKQHTWLIENDGELLMVCMPHILDLSHESCSYNFSIVMYRFDLSQKSWMAAGEHSKHNLLARKRSSDRTVVHASKYGWMLYCTHQETGSSFFLSNPVTNIVIPLPRLPYNCRAATFTTSPTSPESEILVLCNPCSPFDCSKLCIGRLCLSKSTKWTTRLILESDKRSYRVHYMDGNLYCVGVLGDDCDLMCYNLVHKSWKSLTTQALKQTLPTGFVEIEGELFMLFILDSFGLRSKWSIYRFNWSKECWVAAKAEDLKNTTFFICGETTFSTPSEEINGKKLDDCMLFYLKENSFGDTTSFCCYSLTNKRNVESDIYTWLRMFSNKLISTSRGHRFMYMP